MRGTPEVLWALAELASDASFEKAAAPLGRLAGVEATAKRAERAAKQVGREITTWDEAEPALGEAPAETMCRSPDGTGVPAVRRDAGTGEDGRPSRTREAKVAVFHTAERRNPRTGLPERDAGSARHTAAVDGAALRDVDAEPSAFARRLALKRRTRHLLPRDTVYDPANINRWRLQWGVKQIAFDSSSWNDMFEGSS